MPIEPSGKNPDPTNPGGKNPGGTNPNMPTIPDPTDTEPPAVVSGVAFGDLLNVITWMNPADADFSGVLILRNTVSIVDAPSAGTEYTVGDDIDSSEVVQSANSSDFGVSTATVGTSYYYKIFAYDASHNYAAGVEIEATRRSGKIIFVNAAASGTGDGTSWSNAYSSLNSALTSSVATNKIVVAKGVYKPTSTTSDRNATFQLVSKVKVYGGFVGTEHSLSQRNWRVNKTILSGDIGGDDTDSNDDGIIENASHIVGSNSYTVVIGASNTTLEGFTITAGQSNGSDINVPRNAFGGGMRNVNNDNVTLSNIIFFGNTANGGGGLLLSSSVGSTINLSNVFFSGNASVDPNGFRLGGGGLYNEGYDGILENVVFSDNTSDVNGGGLQSDRAAVNFTLNNVVFSNNTATDAGGAAFFQNENTVTLTNVIMWGNTAGTCTGGSFRGNQNICSNRSSTNNRIINISHSLIQGCGASGSTWAMGTSSCGDDNDGDDSTGNNGDGGNNIDADPLFDDDLRLMATSPAIDAGSNGPPGMPLFPAGATDLAGKARIVGSSIDMGAYESQ